MNAELVKDEDTGGRRVVSVECFGRSERDSTKEGSRVTILEVLRKVRLGMKACECCRRATRVMCVCCLQQRNEE